MKTISWLACFTCLMAAAVAHGANSVADASACSLARLQARANGPIHIESATQVAAAANVPAHCAVLGFIDHGSRIRFSLALPDTWNGKFLFFGVGGFGGVLAPVTPGVARGYATATTDTGHQGTTVEDAAWALNNPAGLINHYEWGVELAARAAKGLTAAYYSAVPARSYFQGCSAGGRQGLIQAQRFPGSFDGIVAEAPAWSYSKLLTTFVENGKKILQSAHNWIGPDALREIDRVVLGQCDAADGVKDGIVMDPTRCDPDLRSLACRSGSNAQTCLSAAQQKVIDTLREPVFGGKRAGYFGFPLTGSDGSGQYAWGWSEWIFGTLPPVPDASGALNFRASVLPAGAERGQGPLQFVLGEQFFRYMVMNDAAFDARSFSFERDTPKLERALGDVLDADDTDLGRFVRSGAKLLIWHGWSDPAIPPGMAIDLYERIRRDTRAGATPLDESVRLFMVPGMQHCGGGSGLTAFDALATVEQWVEQGRAPERIVASQLIDGKIVRSRPLCAYPKTARYRGTGNADSADNFYCD